jgi:hypothetical protein
MSTAIKATFANICSMTFLLANRAEQFLFAVFCNVIHRAAVVTLQNAIDHFRFRSGGGSEHIG